MPIRMWRMRRRWRTERSDDDRPMVLTADVDRDGTVTRVTNFTVDDVLAWAERRAREVLV
jgi:hypothetical protein